MARPLRIQYPHAWYHVMNRARQGNNTFTDKDDFIYFIGLLQAACSMWQLRVAAYCLMNNHYHLLVQTPAANLDRCMRHINGVYTQRFNKKLGTDGSLFRGRYKAMLVDADAYLLELVRYIHRNPIEAGLASRPADYQWSSHRWYVSEKESWLYCSFVLSLLTEKKQQQRIAYKAYINRESPEKIKDIFSKKKLPSILGTTKFVDNVRKQFFRWQPESENPEACILTPTIEQISEAVAVITALHLRSREHHPGAVVKTYPEILPCIYPECIPVKGSLSLLRRSV